MALTHRQRIMIIGQPGSGKSTLARMLGDLLELPVVHIDRIHWQPGWKEREPTEKGRLCHEVHIRPAWVFEGGHSATWPERLERADTLIWLNFPVSVRAWRVILRTLKHHGNSRPDLPDGCPEHFNWEFTHWIWSTRNTGRLKMHKFFEAAPATKEKHQLRSRDEVEAFLTELGRETSTVTKKVTQ